MLPDDPQTSLHAMIGNSNLETLRINDNIHNKELTILVDGQSTRNFIQDRSIKYLGLQVTQSKEVNVQVRNWYSSKCNTICSNLLVTLGNRSFTIDLSRPFHK